MKNDFDFVFVDTETSGLDPDVHEMIELAAVRLSADLKNEKRAIEHKIFMKNPSVMTAEARAVNGYNEDEWKGSAKHVRVALTDFIDMMNTGTVVLVGHNPLFDFDFIRSAAYREGLKVPRPRRFLGTDAIAWPLLVHGFVQSVSLETLCERYGISNAGSHRAMNDVRRTLALYKKLMGTV